MLERPTRLLLRAAGLGAGMREVDLGTGLGHVARLAAELVGQTGSVLGIERSREALAVARERTARAGIAHVDFVEGDVTTWRTSEPVDAIVGRSSFTSRIRSLSRDTTSAISVPQACSSRLTSILADRAANRLSPSWKTRSAGWRQPLEPPARGLALAPGSAWCWTKRGLRESRASAFNSTSHPAIRPDRRCLRPSHAASRRSSSATASRRPSSWLSTRSRPASGRRFAALTR
jgi:SAM-dependent methyltransferase